METKRPKRTSASGVSGDGHRSVTAQDEQGNSLGIKVLTKPWPEGVDIAVQVALLNAVRSFDEQFERAMSFRFDEESGYPVDPETGYYFVPEHNLFFDAASQCYLTYTNGQYCYHSSLASTSGDSTGDTDQQAAAVSCMSLLVTESDVVPVGSCVPITTEGVVIGRREPEASVCVPDKQLSRRHCEVVYRPNLSRTSPFWLFDMDSKNGTLHNDKWLEGREDDDDGVALTNGDVISVGASTKFEVHLHPNNGYCEKCQHAWVAPDTQKEQKQQQRQATIEAEPLTRSQDDMQPQEQQYSNSNSSSSNATAVPGTASTSTSGRVYEYVPGESMVDRRKQVQKQLRQLKREIMQGGAESTTVKPEQGDSDKYLDRAQMRRTAVGSEPIMEPRPTRQATENTPVPEDNVGRRLLSKMGWEGTGLGKEEQGIAEPIRVKQNQSRAGLGM